MDENTKISYCSRIEFSINISKSQTSLSACSSQNSGNMDGHPAALKSALKEEWWKFFISDYVLNTFAVALNDIIQVIKSETGYSYCRWSHFSDSWKPSWYHELSVFPRLIRYIYVA